MLETLFVRLVTIALFVIGVAALFPLFEASPAWLFVTFAVPLFLPSWAISRIYAAYSKSSE
ncbi:hypothetical protein [Lysobacter humi (ex Lee et al. 2017)]